MENYMKFKCLLIAALSFLTFGLSGCGGGAGMNGSIEVTATTTGSVIKATATYTNPTVTNLIGVPITFTAQIGSQTFDLGTVSTNNSGAVTVAFTPPAFSGTQTVTVIAKTGNLTNFASVAVAGRTLKVTAPPTIALTSNQPAGTPIDIPIPPIAGFVSITDPFGNDVNGHQITITATVSKTDPTDTVVQPVAVSTDSSGTASFPGAVATLHVPAAVGGVDTMTITWTVTDTVTGQTGTAITTITLTRTA
jgi:hypothetical protein